MPNWDYYLFIFLRLPTFEKRTLQAWTLTQEAGQQSHSTKRSCWQRFFVCVVCFWHRMHFSLETMSQTSLQKPLFPTMPSREKSAEMQQGKAWETQLVFVSFGKGTGCRCRGMMQPQSCTWWLWHGQAWPVWGDIPADARAPEADRGQRRHFCLFNSPRQNRHRIIPVNQDLSM
jgi:hypothetical protein